MVDPGRQFTQVERRLCVESSAVPAFRRNNDDRIQS